MKSKANSIGMYVLSLMSVFLPWFTYNASLMGYCWGFSFLEWMAVPLIVIGIYLFTPGRKLVWVVLAELSMVANLAVLVIAFGRWQELCNIAAGFRWQDGLSTAQPGYWISVVLFLALFIAFQVDLVRNKTVKTGEVPGCEKLA